MGEPGEKYRARLSIANRIGAIGAAYLLLLFSGPFLRTQFDRLHDWWWNGDMSWPSGGAVHRVVDLLGHAFMAYFPAGFVTVFVASIALLPLGYLARTLARARVREGGRDPIAPIRRWAEAHPALVRALSVVPAAAWAAWIEIEAPGPWGAVGQLDPMERLGVYASFGIMGVLATCAMTWFVRAGLRSFLEPITEDTLEQTPAVAADEITFDAVAVTTETQAALGAMLALNAAAVAVALMSEHAFRDPRILAGLVAYAAVSLGGAALFRRASKVAIGVDGVLVAGTSRTRFFAYRDLDAARVDGAELRLVRRDEVVLRLQLHGEDASKRNAVLARIRDAIDRVKEGRRAVSAQILASSTPEQLAQAAGGAASYRDAALTREQLWALVEGPEIDGDARRAAAEALATASGPEERARLRVVAEQCAAPAVRVALEHLARGEVHDEDAPVAGAMRREA